VIDVLVVGWELVAVREPYPLDDDSVPDELDTEEEGGT
jgi:hypothetical protein